MKPIANVTLWNLLDVKPSGNVPKGVAVLLSYFQEEKGRKFTQPNYHLLSLVNLSQLTRCSLLHLVDGCAGPLLAAHDHERPHAHREGRRRRRPGAQFNTLMNVAKILTKKFTKPKLGSETCTKYPFIEFSSTSITF